jgi:hypothetical protein
MRLARAKNFAKKSLTVFEIFDLKVLRISPFSRESVARIFLKIGSIMPDIAPELLSDFRELLLYRFREIFVRSETLLRQGPKKKTINGVVTPA